MCPQVSTCCALHTIRQSGAGQTDHGNVVGNELPDGDTELARAEALLHIRVQGGGGQGVLHAAHHVLAVLLTALGQAQHFLQMPRHLSRQSTTVSALCVIRLWAQLLAHKQQTAVPLLDWLVYVGMQQGQAGAEAQQYG